MRESFVPPAGGSTPSAPAEPGAFAKAVLSEDGGKRYLDPAMFTELPLSERIGAVLERRVTFVSATGEIVGRREALAWLRERQRHR